MALLAASSWLPIPIGSCRLFWSCFMASKGINKKGLSESAQKVAQWLHKLSEAHAWAGACFQGFPGLFLVAHSLPPLSSRKIHFLLNKDIKSWAWLKNHRPSHPMLPGPLVSVTYQRCSPEWPDLLVEPLTLCTTLRNSLSRPLPLPLGIPPFVLTAPPLLFPCS